jgi:5-methylcytosine-specific restriction endonuclease McrA
VQTGARPTLAEPNETWVANVPSDVGRLFRACLHTVQRRLNASPGAALEAMFDHCLATWRARPGGRRLPPEQRVFERDGWRCTVPGCTSQRSLHAHHIVFRSAGGGDEDANLTTLCAFHHQRGVHAGVIRVSGRAPDGLVFELPLGRFGAGDVVLPPSP